MRAAAALFFFKKKSVLMIFAEEWGPDMRAVCVCVWVCVCGGSADAQHIMSG